MEIKLTSDRKNMTPAVISAINELVKTGGELHFEKGEYHFFKDGTEKRFFGVSNNSACDKYMVFPIINGKDITIDGHGSVFVFHDIVFPFMVSHSENITLKNFTVDTGVSPVVEFFTHGLTDDGFYMDIDRKKSPFFVKDGALCFERESEIVSGENEYFSLHEIGIHNVQYFATGNCKADMSNLAAPLMWCDVSETEGGIYAKYHKDSPTRCKFSDMRIASIIDGKRDVDVICLDNSKNIKIKDIKVARGIGMGIVAQLTTDIEIDGFCTDIGYHQNATQTLTADSLHFINCDGRLEIKNCVISDTMDDATNVHGMYTSVTAADDNTVFTKICHQEQRYFNPYRPGDRLEIIDGDSLTVVAEFIVNQARFYKDDGENIEIGGCFTYGKDKVMPHFLVENPDRMPDLYMHRNHFYNFPHNRISGGGKMVIENNHFHDCLAALVSQDLAKYWYESGRINHLVFKNNILENCNGWGGNAFIRIGADGFDFDKTPLIHKYIEISNNSFSNIRKYAVKAGGVQELVIKDNKFDVENNDIILIGGRDI